MILNVQHYSLHFKSYVSFILDFCLYLTGEIVLAHACDITIVVLKGYWISTLLIWANIRESFHMFFANLISDLI